jgi:hypothetical protein
VQPELADQGAKVRLITFADQAGNATRGALNDAATAGAIVFYVVFSSVDWAEDASVVGNALQCS